MAILAVRPTGTTATSFADTLPADARQMAPLRDRLRGWLAPFGLGSRLEYNIILGIGEALANAIEHGSGHDRHKTVSVEVFARPDAICATVSDTGQWTSDSAASHRSAHRGRGLTLINGTLRTADATRTTVTATGEIDVTNAADFIRSVEDIPAPRPLIVDLSNLHYLDSAGFAALDQLLGRRAIVIVLDPDSPVRAAAALMGLPCHHSVDAAATAPS